MAAHARGRPRSLTYQHRTGGLTSGPANWVLSMCGRLEVVQSTGARTFKQNMWRVAVCVCGALALRCGRSLRKDFNFSAFSVAPKYGEWIL